MAEYELLEHTADTGFRVRAASLEGLFARAAEALVAIALDPSGTVPKEQRSVVAPGDAPEELLVNWLNEVLWLLEGERFVPARFEAVSVTEGVARGAAWGEPRDDGRHPPRIVVKAVTYHQLAVRAHNGGWEAEVFLDV